LWKGKDPECVIDGGGVHVKKQRIAFINKKKGKIKSSGKNPKNNNKRDMGGIRERRRLEKKSRTQSRENVMEKKNNGEKEKSRFSSGKNGHLKMKAKGSTRRRRKNTNSLEALSRGEADTGNAEG